MSWLAWYFIALGVYVAAVFLIPLVRGLVAGLRERRARR